MTVLDLGVRECCVPHIPQGVGPNELGGWPLCVCCRVQTGTSATSAAQMKAAAKKCNND